MRRRRRTRKRLSKRPRGRDAFACVNTLNVIIANFQSCPIDNPGVRYRSITVVGLFVSPPDRKLGIIHVYTVFFFLLSVA